MTPELTELLHEIPGHSADHRFGHREHINLAWLAVRRYGMPEAADKICGWLRQLTAYERAPQKYHHTMSRAWVRLVAHHTTTDPFDQFITDHPALLDKRLLSCHYSSHMLASAEARVGWTEPDLLPLP
jgi:hypothetical protein